MMGGLTVVFLLISPLNTILNEVKGNIFSRFMVDGDVQLLIAFAMLVFYLLDHNIFVQDVGGWFGHTPLNKFIPFLVYFMFSNKKKKKKKLKDKFSF